MTALKSTVSMIAACCYPDAQLADFSAGRLSRTDGEACAAHLAECPACVARLDHVAAEDPFLLALRSAYSVADLAADDPGVARVADQVWQRYWGAAQGFHEAAAQLEALQHVFQPPQHAGELGRLGGFIIQELLGHGGMGAVYRAVDESLQRPVALKLMFPRYAQDPAARMRFLREAQTMAAVSDDHLVAVFQAGEIDGQPFLAQELLSDGETLAARCERVGRWPVCEALDVAIQIARGLAVAHQAGVLHRDVKPSNLWIDAAGRVRILDFGLAHWERRDVRLTESGVILGTPHYMAPEQAQGEQVDARADLFSLGAVLYVLLTGRQPFPGDNPAAILASLLTRPAKPPREFRDEIPQPLSEFVLKLLAKDREQRPRDAAEVARTLQDLQGLPPLPSGARPRKTADRRWRGAMAVAGVLFAGALCAFLWPPQQDRGASAGDEHDHTAAQPTPPREAGSMAEPVRQSPTPAAERDPIVEFIARHPDPRVVDFRGTPVTPAGLEVLARLTRLEELILYRSEVQDDHLEVLSNFPQLRHLGLDFNLFAGPGLRHLSHVPQLEVLGLGGAQLTPAGYRCLAACSNLRELYLHLSNVSDGDLAVVARLPELRTLNVSHTAITKEGVAALRGHPHLETLTLYFTQVSDEALRSLAPLPSLTHLGLDGAPITDVGLASLADFPKLEILGLWKCPGVTDAGVPALARLTALRTLWIPETGISPQGVATLQAALPNRNIVTEPPQKSPH